MTYVLVMLLGIAVSGICTYMGLHVKRIAIRKQKHEQEAEAQRLRASELEIEDAWRKLAEETLRARQQLAEETSRARHEVAEATSRLKADKEGFEARVISYEELQDENMILKRDLQNVDVNVRKLQMDHDLQQHEQDGLAKKVAELGGRYMKDNVDWIASSLTPNNFSKCKNRLQKVIERCRGIGFAVSEEEEGELLKNLKDKYEHCVRAAFEREEQARIKQQIREEQKLEREIERELKQLERERAAIKEALDKALAESKDERSAEVERLKTRLAEAEEKSQRAVSRAQMTKSGHVYVISNIGSFGEGVFKIGMTRRLEPLDRVKELGDASVPFPFDVHMMISSDDAPALESTLHRKLHEMRLNKVNPRKEFFRAKVSSIMGFVREHHGDVEYVADPEALEYRQTLEMSAEDQEFIEEVFDKLVDRDDSSNA